jgi:hypothetical protein
VLHDGPVERPAVQPPQLHAVARTAGLHQEIRNVSQCSLCMLNNYWSFPLTNREKQQNTTTIQDFKSKDHRLLFFSQFATG